MIVQAPAKINLHLDVGPKRRDGYHSLKTIFQEISLADTLRLAVRPKEINLTVTPRGLPTGSDNLIVKALERLRSELKISSGMDVHLTKRIPMGAGLGGGSSDAAAALWGGWMLWKMKSRARNFARPRRVPPLLTRCAQSLGADVPFFLRGGTAWAEGIGEKLTALNKAPKKWLVLIYPRAHVSTPEAYRLLDEARRQNKKRPAASPDIFFNSFEPVILRRFPAVAAAKKALLELGCARAMMSGSGSAVYGLVSSKRQGSGILRRLRKRRWDVFLVST